MNANYNHVDPAPSQEKSYARPTSTLRRDYEEVLYELMTQAAIDHSWGELLGMLRSLPNDHPLRQMILITGGKIRLVRSPEMALRLMVTVLNPNQEDCVREKLVHVVEQACAVRNLPSPVASIPAEEDSSNWFG